MNPRKCLSAEECEYLRDYLLSRVSNDTRNATMLLVAIESGARAQELLNIEWGDINILSGEIFIKSLKKGIPRVISVNTPVRKALRLLKTISPERPFNISYSRLAAIWLMYRPVKKPFHSLRHSFAQRAYKKKDLRFVQLALGHRSITTTMIYLGYSYSIEEYNQNMQVK